MDKWWAVFSPYYEDALSTLRNKPAGIKHEDVASIASLVEGLNSNPKIRTLVRCQPTGHIFNQNQGWCLIAFRMEMVDKAPERARVFSVQAIAIPG